MTRRSLQVGGAEEVLDTVAKQEFVAEYLLFAVHDRLPGDEAEVLLGGAGRRRKSR